MGVAHGGGAISSKDDQSVRGSPTTERVCNSARSWTRGLDSAVIVQPHSSRAAPRNRGEPPSATRRPFLVFLDSSRTIILPADSVGPCFLWAFSSFRS